MASSPEIRRPYRQTHSLPTANPRRHRIHLTIWWGRFWLLLTFAALIATYVAAIKYMPPDRVNIPRLTAACGIAILWESALVIGIWMRYNWARGLMIGLILAGVLAFAAIIPILHLQRPRNPKKYMQKVEACVLVHIAAAVMLIACKPIRRLTSQAYQ